MYSLSVEETLDIIDETLGGPFLPQSFPELCILHHRFGVPDIHRLCMCCTTEFPKDPFSFFPKS
jgi:hypothetical protein